MTRTVGVDKVDTKHRIGQPLTRRESWVREADVCEQRSEERHDDVPAQQAEADVALAGRDDHVRVEVEEVEMLLDNL